MAVSKRLRYEVLRRDNHTCRYCGSAAPDVKLQVDHVVPKSLGGSDEPANLATACEPCNSGKSSVPADADLVDDVAQDALRWSAAMDRAAEIERKRRADVEDLIDDFSAAWDSTWDPYVRKVIRDPEKQWFYQSNPDRKYEYVIAQMSISSGEVTYPDLFDTYEEAERQIRWIEHAKIPPRSDSWRNTVRNWIDAGIKAEDFASVVEEVIADRGYVEWDNKWKYTAGVCWNLIRSRQAVAHALLAAEEEG